MLSTEFLEHRYDNHSSQSYDILKTTMDYSEVEFNHPENDLSGLGRLNTILTKLMREQI